MRFGPTVHHALREVRNAKCSWLHSSNKCPSCALWKSGLYLGKLILGENQPFSTSMARMLRRGRRFTATKRTLDKGYLPSSSNRSGRKSGKMRENPVGSGFEIRSCFRKVVRGNCKSRNTWRKTHEMGAVLLVLHNPLPDECGNRQPQSGKSGPAQSGQGCAGNQLSTELQATSPRRDYPRRRRHCPLRLRTRESG